MATYDERGGAVRAGSRVLFGALLAFALLVFVLWRTENPRLQGLRATVVDVLAPALEAVSGPSTAVTGLFAGFQSYSDLRAENARLREQLERLRAWRDIAEALEQENARLRALNSVQLPPRVSFVTAEVIGDSGGPFLQSAIVNVGRADGVEDGAPALDAGGLVGRVFGVGEDSARILLLTDPTSRVAVAIGPERIRAILAGDNTETPSLQYLRAPSAVPADARVVTSGEGGVLPEGLPIGRVVDLGDGIARVELSGEIGGLEFLRIYRRADALEDAPDGGLIFAPAVDGLDLAPIVDDSVEADDDLGDEGGAPGAEAGG